MECNWFFLEVFALIYPCQRKYFQEVPVTFQSDSYTHYLNIVLFEALWVQKVMFFLSMCDNALISRPKLLQHSCTAIVKQLKILAYNFFYKSV